MKKDKTNELFKTVDASEEFSPKQIARIKRQEKNRLSGKAEYVSAEEVWEILGLNSR